MQVGGVSNDEWPCRLFLEHVMQQAASIHSFVNHDRFGKCPRALCAVSAQTTNARSVTSLIDDALHFSSGA